MHPLLNDQQNLNSPGMQFKQMNISETLIKSPTWYTYSVIARLGLLAVTEEKKELQGK
jgi:hypothetical protein